MKNVFLLLAVAGAVLPWALLIPFIADHGLAVTTFISALFANGAAGAATADLVISSLVFWIFLYTQGAARIWLYILVNLAVGLSCALPLYLYVRARSAESGGNEGAAAPR